MQGNSIFFEQASDNVVAVALIDQSQTGTSGQPGTTDSPSDAACCDSFSQNMNSCVCGCDTASSCLTSNQQVILWVCGIILVLAVAVTLSTLIVRRLRKKPGSKNK